LHYDTILAGDSRTDRQNRHQPMAYTALAWSRAVKKEQYTVVEVRCKVIMCDNE